MYFIIVVRLHSKHITMSTPTTTTNLTVSAPLPAKPKSKLPILPPSKKTAKNLSLASSLTKQSKLLEKLETTDRSLEKAVASLYIPHKLEDLPSSGLPPNHLPGSDEHRKSLLQLYDNWRAEVIAGDTAPYFENLTAYLGHKYGLGKHMLHFHAEEDYSSGRESQEEDEDEKPWFSENCYVFKVAYMGGDGIHICYEAIKELEMILTVWFKKSFFTELNHPKNANNEGTYVCAEIDIRKLPPSAGSNTSEES